MLQAIFSRESTSSLNMERAFSAVQVVPEPFSDTPLYSSPNESNRLAFADPNRFERNMQASGYPPATSYIVPIPKIGNALKRLYESAIIGCGDLAHQPFPPESGEFRGQLRQESMGCFQSRQRNSARFQHSSGSILVRVQLLRWPRNSLPGKADLPRPQFGAVAIRMIEPAQSFQIIAGLANSDRELT